jgi:hypothetical protein
MPAKWILKNSWTKRNRLKSQNKFFFLLIDLSSNYTQVDRRPKALTVFIHHYDILKSSLWTEESEDTTRLFRLFGHLPDVAFAKLKILELIKIVDFVYG